MSARRGGSLVLERGASETPQSGLLEGAVADLQLLQGSCGASGRCWQSDLRAWQRSFRKLGDLDRRPKTVAGWASACGRA